MGKRSLKSKSSEVGGLTTMAGLARKLGVHKGTISRRAKKKGLTEKYRVGHQVMLNGAGQSALKKGGPKGRPKGS